MEGSVVLVLYGHGHYSKASEPNITIQSWFHSLLCHLNKNKCSFLENLLMQLICHICLGQYWPACIYTFSTTITNNIRCCAYAICYTLMQSQTNITPGIWWLKFCLNIWVWKAINQPLNEQVCVWKSLKQAFEMYWNLTSKDINNQNQNQTSSAKAKIKGAIIISASMFFSSWHSGQTSQEQ